MIVKRCDRCGRDTEMLMELKVPTKYRKEVWNIRHVNLCQDCLISFMKVTKKWWDEDLPI